MKLLSFALLLSVLFSCKQSFKHFLKEENRFAITVDSTICDSAEQRMISVNDSNFAFSYEVPVEARFYSNNVLEDSLIDNHFDMMSWYSSHGDTIDLVAHIGELQTFALLVRFIHGKPSVFFYRAPHDISGSKYFKIQKTDSFSHDIYVPPTRYQLKLSEMPDTVRKPGICGFIEMESGNYYDKRDSAGAALKVQMKFYFQSSYRDFAYLNSR